MPLEAKPLFRPDVLRPHLTAFEVPPRVAAYRQELAEWAKLLGSPDADKKKERELLPGLSLSQTCQYTAQEATSRRAAVRF